MANNGKPNFFSNILSGLDNNIPFFEGNRPEDENPYFKQFYELGSKREEVVGKRSVSKFKFEEGNVDLSNIASNSDYFNWVYAGVNTNKIMRLGDYRMMSAYSDVADALDEICDDFIVEDDRGNVTNLKFDRDVPSEIQEELQKEYRYLERQFKLKQKGWEYIRKILIEGELYFEHIISEKNPDYGIIGVLELANEIVDPIFESPQCFDVRGYVLRKTKLNPENKHLEMIFVPMEKKQVTYVHSHMFDNTKSVRMPFLENCRRAYRQLTMIEDAIIIYRMINAPERLVFNVEVGNLPKPQAEQHIKGLMQKFWSRKTFDANSNTTGTGTINTYNPQSQLDAFWFPQRNGQKSVSVDKLAGGQSLGQLEDLNFFQRKLYRALKVPSNRLDPNSAFNDGEQITREELKLANFVVRLQMWFSEALKDCFITHLKLRKLWDEYELHEGDFDISMNPPKHFFELRKQQMLELKLNNYREFIGNELVSERYCQKHYLNWSETEISINSEWLRKDAALKWELGKIVEMGPDFREQLEAQAQGGGDPNGGGMPPAGPGGGGGGMPGSALGGAGGPMADGMEDGTAGPGGGDMNSPPAFGNEPVQGNASGDENADDESLEDDEQK